MGMFGDNFYSWLDRTYAADKAAMDADFREKDHPREGKGGVGGGRFTKKEETLQKEDDRDNVSPEKAPHGQSERLAKSKEADKPLFREVSAKEYAEAIAKAKADCISSHSWRVDAKPENGYKDSKARLVSDKGSCIAVQADGDIVSLCKREGDKIPATIFMEAAVAHKGDRLDTFEGNYGLYRRSGFTPISWTPFNVDFAPEGWKESGAAPEDIIFFAYTGDKKKMTRAEADEELRKWKAEHNPHTGESGYDDALRERNEFLEKKTER